ncbi:MAG TPA: prolyl oligopeptidase family serine peptidase [Candidatus Acidoferrales bacterium]|nr:prolyl oligopeptidase family serine peptidase [Candidatus Acidoferrales bacterium]
MAESFPRQQARTRHFSLGVPRNVAISADGSRVAFLRTRSGADQATCLWVLDVASGTERLVVDPTAVGGNGAGEIPAEERARRERARESSGGIVRFSADRALRRALFDLGGRLYVVDLETQVLTEIPTGGVAIDPHLDPTGTSIAYVERGALHAASVDGAAPRVLAAPDDDNVTYGLAEFVAAEEMGRQKGYWWSPDGSRLLVARVDVSPVQRWHIADPSNPQSRPTEVAYPKAGTDNALVSLHVIGHDGTSVPVRWDAAAFEYVTTADWSEHGLLVVVQTRDQRAMRLLDVNPDTGETSVLRDDVDEWWVDIVGGVPAHLSDGTLVWTADRDGAKRLLVGDEPVTDTTLEVRGVLDVDGDVVLFSASVERTVIGVYTWSRTDGVRPLPGLTAAGVSQARRSGGTTVLVRRALDAPGVRVSVHRGDQEVARIESFAEQPAIALNVRMVTLGERDLRAAVLFPHGYTPGSATLPVLLDPYGGPRHQQVLDAAGSYFESQWFADQGFVVLVTDGRGTPGGGPAWERSVRGDVATPVLEDQVDALHAAAARWPDFDLSRVAIRGWSYGGYLAALAVLRRPDVFHVAVSGAPVTDWGLYDTHYTERYLGHPAREPANYDQMSLLRQAGQLERPLMLIHGLSDDNVVVAHTLRFSSALLAAGRAHTVLPLTGATHMANDPVIAENLLLLELEFIRHALGIPSAGT